MPESTAGMRESGVRMVCEKAMEGFFNGLQVAIHDSESAGDFFDRSDCAARHALARRGFYYQQRDAVGSGVLRPKESRVSAVHPSSSACMSPAFALALTT